MKKLLLAIIFSLLIMSCTSPLKKEYSSNQKIIDEVVKSLDSANANLLVTSINRLKLERCNINDLSFEDILKNGQQWESDRKQNIDILKYYIDNQYKSLADENGISQYYEVRTETMSKSKKYEFNFDNNASNGTLPGNYTIFSYNIINRYKLFLNGTAKGEIDLNGYLLQLVGNNQGYKPQDFKGAIYIPELDLSQKKSIIESWTDSSYGVENSQYFVKALYACSMLVKN